MQGKIVDLGYEKGSGCCTVIIESKGDRFWIPADAGQTFRALTDAFGSVQDAIGKTIEYTMTEYGTMESFEPLEV